MLLQGFAHLESSMDSLALSQRKSPCSLALAKLSRMRMNSMLTQPRSVLLANAAPSATSRGISCSGVAARLSKPCPGVSESLWRALRSREEEARFSPLRVLTGLKKFAILGEALEGQSMELRAPDAALNWFRCSCTETLCRPESVL